jgi:hypothetical protein
VGYLQFRETTALLWACCVLLEPATLVRVFAVRIVRSCACVCAVPCALAPWILGHLRKVFGLSPVRHHHCFYSAQRLFLRIEVTSGQLFVPVPSTVQ